MEVISKTKILGDGDIELSPEAKEKLKKLVGKTVRIVVQEEKELASPLLELCGRADVEIKDGSLNHDKYIYGGK
ncbi:hypothetical protein KsCSTR_47610 [Candidatus Kuenenia stuttgartiensis]|uniref:Uncharacterized protein n=1 Tax=Kuenenia stuttgartiensis TaxID=174633 RepID=A0A6G7GX18_KUEST|nr:hypothetical protein [Candidatus Kuenenia stuttgartiensis]MBE7546037.1 hypothetical protein [Planctomycetia bacterium]MBU1205993.1 hypothetical protein [Pseudomonadota bacterium]QII14138.1 hypothetical protein KsCSTR_47610 [Candidatus Kuenenia stuttgartiensis]